MFTILQGLLGLAVMILLAWAISEGRSRVRPRVIVAGLLCQCGLAAVLLKFPGASQLFEPLNALVRALQQATAAGSAFVFGFVGGGAAPYAVTSPPNGFVLAFQALPLVLVISALSALLFHWRVLPVIVRGFSWLLRKTFGIGGAVGFASAANVFVGMTEAPLLIRPYLSGMSRSELFAVMVTGMATIAGTVMVLYATLLEGSIPDPVRHLLIASLISAPASLLIAHVMIPPEREAAARQPSALPEEERLRYHSAMDAVTRGTLDGLQLWLNIIAMLLVLVALVHLANLGLAWIPEIAGAPLTLERLLGWAMAPIVWLTGIPWAESITAGALMGVKTVLNEFIAYIRLAGLPEGALSERSRLIMTYSLCGFANIGSLGILIGGLGVLAPERRGEIVDLGLRSLYAGTLATLMTGAVVGLVI
ncbi:NupC/NupG family nucleoside CNT transporter [Azotobacter vinelandii]|uniref:NupC/NupG family nucleoside CNT transporter n=1 Tax=Azotobacter vinelandii TaxID=354 RepID=UPI00077385BE|nr:nucleoside transporter C-terminal domain-containing protein [Azotobacter vinelandii]WKN23689.1 nucleoside:proton symporter [Azotobacter vinelandii]